MPEAAAPPKPAKATEKPETGNAQAFRDLSGDEANEFLAQATRRGEYQDAVDEFVKSDAKLRVFSLETGPFAGKKVRAVRAGMNTAIKNAQQVDKIKFAARGSEVGLQRV